jgi:hypothetical protein
VYLLCTYRYLNMIPKAGRFGKTSIYTNTKYGRLERNPDQSPNAQWTGTCTCKHKTSSKKSAEDHFDCQAKYVVNANLCMHHLCNGVKSPKNKKSHHHCCPTSLYKGWTHDGLGRDIVKVKTCFESWYVDSGL